LSASLETRYLRRPRKGLTQSLQLYRTHKDWRGQALCAVADKRQNDFLLWEIWNPSLPCNKVPGFSCTLQSMCRARQSLASGRKWSPFTLTDSLLFQAVTDAAEYQSGSAVFVAKIKKLETMYKSIRRARGDGNCFFRSFIFAYMESLVHTADLTERNRFALSSFRCVSW
jgi:hypothetical protein